MNDSSDYLLAVPDPGQQADNLTNVTLFREPPSEISPLDIGLTVTFVVILIFGVLGKCQAVKF